MAREIMWHASYGRIYDELVRWMVRALEAEAKLGDRVRPEMRGEQE